MKVKSAKYEKRIDCPILSKKISVENCEDVANVAEDFHPERFAPEKFRNVIGYKKICKECSNNPYNN